MILTEYNSFKLFEIVFNIRSKRKLFGNIQSMCQISTSIKPRISESAYKRYRVSRGPPVLAISNQ